MNSNILPLCINSMILTIISHVQRIENICYIYENNIYDVLLQ